VYGFRKVYQLNLSYDESTDKRTVWQFKHECFRKDQPEKLCEIKRRASKSNQQQQQNGPSSSSSSSLQQQQQQQNNTAYNLNNNNNNNNNTNYTNQQQHTEFGLNGESIEQTLQRFTDRLEQADKKRRELWEQTVKLSQIQARQQKVKIKNIVFSSSIFFLIHTRQYVFLQNLLCNFWKIVNMAIIFWNSKKKKKSV
jgi:hypothetical protein